MRTLKFTPTMKHLLLLVAMLFCSMLSVFADDSSLITQQITINVPKAGTLKDKINSNRKYMITNLKLTGELNNDDFEFIREMAGCYKEDGSKYDGHLQYLDLEKVELKRNGYESFKVYCDLEDEHYGSTSKSQEEQPSPYSVYVSPTVIKGVFAYLYDLKSIVIPEGVSYIGERTFQCCHSLSSLTLPSTLESVGYDAFKRMGARSFSLYVKSATPPYLRNIRWCYAYKNGKQIWQEESPFFLTGGINTLYISKGTLKLYKDAVTWKEDFKRVKSVVEIDPIPSEELITEQRTVNVENPGSLSSLINDYDKHRITNLKLKGELDIQDVEFIREMAGCYAEGGVPKYNGHLWYLDMSEVKFKSPKEYAYLTIYDKDGGEDNAYIEGEEFSCKRTKKLLAYLYNLQSVVLPVDSSKDNIYFLDNCSGLTSVKLPSEATHIAEGAFWGCSGLTSIDIPSGVTSIGDDAFWDCSGLTSIVIPSGVTSIGEYAFWGCSGLTSVKLPSEATHIAKGAFYECSGLTSIDIPSSVTSIGRDAFCFCSGLTSIVIPSGVTSIEDGAFWGCSGLTSIVIPSGVTSIAEGTFNGCSGLTSIVIPSCVTSIGEYAFYGCSGLTSIDIPSGVTSIGDCAFRECSKLTSIVIPSGVTSIAEGTFTGCSGLTSIDIPSCVTSIGDWAFSDCRGLTSIDIPSGVTSIAKSTFSGCSGLTSIDIPSCVTSIGDWAFSDCSGLTSIDIPSGVTSIANGTFSGCRGLTSIDIPSCVTSIGESAFWWCTGLTSIDLPSGVTSIGNRAFMNCSKLTSVVIPSGVTSIESETFRQCYGLTSIVIPSGVTSIGNEVFEYCDALSSIIIPSSVTSIGKGTFKGCYNLTSLYSYRPVPVAVDSNVFSGIDANKCTLYVPQGSFGNYYVTSGWDYFSKIVEFDPTGIDAVTTKSDAKEVSRYSVDGQKLDTPVKGLNIVKYNDGSIKKVVVE